MRKHTKNITVLLCACFLAALFFRFLYYYDNKYTTKNVILQGGFTIPNSDSLAKGEVAWLVDGWDFWHDLILAPSQLEAYPSTPIYIGQYFSFSAFHEDATPYGKATYRLRLAPDQSNSHESYVLYIPEGFCASAVYVDGKRVGGAGNVEPYKPSVRDILVAVPLNSTEIVIQTANYSHYYSGLTYPLALGTPNGINRLIAGRMLFYGFLCFSSLSIALFSIAVWLGRLKQRENRLNLWFGVLALSFALRICYPFIRLFGVPIIQPLYALEDAAAMLGVWCVIRLALSLCRVTDRRLTLILDCIAGGFTALGGLMPLMVLPIFPAFAPIYGQLVFWYKLVSAVALVVLTFCGGVNSRTIWLITGVSIYSISLVARMLCLGRFEPAYTGWQDEWGTYALVICFALLMVRRSQKIAREHAHLTQHLQDDVATKTATLTVLLQERRQLLAGFAHDLKAPITSMTTFARLVEEGGISLDEETHTYLSIIRRKTEEMRCQLDKMQEFAIQDAQPMEPQSLNLVSLLTEFHTANLPDMDVSGVRFELELPHEKQVIILGDNSRLTRVLQNLVYNAVSFTPIDGLITLSLQTELNRAIIRVTDTGCGISPANIPHIFERFFSNRSDDDGAGLGLYICKSIIQEHGGTIEVDSLLNNGAIFTIGLPIATYTKH